MKSISCVGSRRPILIVFFILFFNLFIYTGQENTFEENWFLIQKEYSKMVELYNLKGYDRFCIEGWKSKRKKIGNMINGKPNRGFLNHGSIKETMMRNKVSDFEEIYLLKCLSAETKEKLDRFKDVDWLPRISRTFNCSANSLGQLYYAAKIFENMKNKKIKTIIEFGGGYGAFARILKMMDPNLTIFVIDLPEFISLQALFLRETLKSEDVVVHYEIPQQYKRGSINLIPIYLIEDVDLSVDVFVSNFGLSEVKVDLQDIVIDRKFFNADFSFITGQFDQGNIFRGLKSCYSEVLINPFHLVLHSYELTARCQI
ncbi:putative sugar O-methyltransferase [Candidatus Dependentiae bacterium]